MSAHLADSMNAPAFATTGHASLRWSTNCFAASVESKVIAR